MDALRQIVTTIFHAAEFLGLSRDDPRSLVMSWIENRDSENWALIGYSLQATFMDGLHSADAKSCKGSMKLTH